MDWKSLSRRGRRSAFSPVSRLVVLGGLLVVLSTWLSSTAPGVSLPNDDARASGASTDRLSAADGATDRLSGAPGSRTKPPPDPVFPAAVAAARGSDGSTCPLGAALEKDGQRPLAFVVGVGTYQNRTISPLRGAPSDARAIYDRLVDPGGFAFPKQNVCLIVDSEATTAKFKELWQKVLVERARPNDPVVFYFAGHGSQSADLNEDEPDELDETFMFHDTRSGTVRDFTDDEFGVMLKALQGKTRNVTVILDSCNSGSASRMVPAEGVAARFVAPAEVGPDSGGGGADTAFPGDKGASWTADDQDGLVLLSAAVDGTVALEKGGQGVFTRALLEILDQNTGVPLTYRQLAAELPLRIAAVSYQVPAFQGDLERRVFGSGRRQKPLSLEVVGLAEDLLTLRGARLPGMGVQALLRVYDGSSPAGDLKDPRKGKAVLSVEADRGLEVQARVISRPTGAAPIRAGDLALLVSPGEDAIRLQVRLRAPREPGGIPQDRANAIRKAVQEHEGAGTVIEWATDSGPAWVLSLNVRGQVQLVGLEGRIRNTFTLEDGLPEGRTVAHALWLHARQRALLQLRGEGGADFTNQQTLQVRAVPSTNQGACSKGEWVQAPANQEQVIPLCHRWNIELSLSMGSPAPLLVGALMLSSDGSIFGFPRSSKLVRLEPGAKVVFPEAIVAGLPLDIRDTLLAFGTREDNPVYWSEFTDVAARSLGPEGAAPGPLSGRLKRFMAVGGRGASLAGDSGAEGSWTSSSVPLRVEANSRFLVATGELKSEIQKREYTLPNFDLRPYLPDSTESSLARVLQQADGLARLSSKDGVGYKQHDWSLESDQENLKRGIDCSRAIWFAFTRAGLPYNKGNRYLSTSGMIGAGSAMNEEFVSCSGDPNLQLGDVLVFRDETRGDGHTVMVIDPQKRIAWGSHGWDGNVREGKQKDNGVEYQIIKYKQDWARWDRSTMKRKACWRHKRFVAEAGTPGAQTGILSLENACNARLKCGAR